MAGREDARELSVQHEAGMGDGLSHTETPLKTHFSTARPSIVLSVVPKPHSKCARPQRAEWEAAGTTAQTSLPTGGGGHADLG